MWVCTNAGNSQKSLKPQPLSSICYSPRREAEFFDFFAVQEAHERALNETFAALDACEELLACRQYLAGDRLTEVCNVYGIWNMRCHMKSVMTNGEQTDG